MEGHVLPPTFAGKGSLIPILCISDESDKEM